MLSVKNIHLDLRKAFDSVKSHFIKAKLFRIYKRKNLTSTLIKNLITTILIDKIHKSQVE